MECFKPAINRHNRMSLLVENEQGKSTDPGKSSGLRKLSELPKPSDNPKITHNFHKDFTRKFIHFN